MSTEPTRRRSVAPLAVAAVALLLLVLFGQFSTTARWGSDLADAAHGPTFALLTAILAVSSRRLRPALSSFAAAGIAIATSVLLGGAIEILQLGIGRDASWLDWWHDGIGSIGGAAAYLFATAGSASRRSRAAQRWAGAIACIAALAVLLPPPLRMALAYHERQRDFPVVADFDSRFATYFVETYSAVTVRREPLPSEFVDGRARHALHAVTTRAEGWGIVIHEPPRDWRGYSALELELANPTGTPLVLNVRVRDDSQPLDRPTGYWERLEIPPQGRARHRLEVASLTARDGRRRADPSRIASIAVTGTRDNAARDFYLLGVRLLD